MEKKSMKRKCDAFFAKMDKLGIANSFSDVRLKTCYSEVLPKDANLSTKFSRNVHLEMPIISSPMDTVTEAKMAITLARLGGLGIIHKALIPEDQAAAVAKVKYELNGFIPNPICVFVDDTIEQVLNMRREKGYKFFSFMVNDRNGKKVGLVTQNDFDFSSNRKNKISDIMSSEIISAASTVSIQAAYKIMLENKKKILPVFNANNDFEGIYTLSDVKRIINGDSNGCSLDVSGRLRVGAAISVGEDIEQRMELLNRQLVDVVVVDTAHGNSKAVVDAVHYCKKYYPSIDVVAGNISEGEAAKRLVDAGADGLKIGQGPGSICTTRIVAGIGCPQLTAIYNCEKAIRGSGVPLCADGGIQLSGDITIALGAGADTVILGNLLAGTMESPGEIIYRGGAPVKMYRGMGSLDAMLANRASRERYGQEGVASDKLVAEGVKGWLNYKGEVTPIIFQLLGGLRSGMGYLGAKDIKMLQKKADFYQITNSGLKESHPHSLDVIEQESKYSSKS